MATLRLDAFLPYRLSLTANRVSEHIATAYEALFGLSIPQWRVIAIVAEERAATQAAICRRSGMDKVTVSRAAIALSGRGLIERSDHEGDRRARLLRLSGPGRALYAAVAPKALELEAALLAGFTEAEIDEFVAMLRRLDAAVPPPAPNRGTGLP